jgi:hypothetical protein
MAPVSAAISVPNLGSFSRASFHCDGDHDTAGFPFALFRRVGDAFGNEIGSTYSMPLNRFGLRKKAQNDSRFATFPNPPN